MDQELNQRPQVQAKREVTQILMKPPKYVSQSINREIDKFLKPRSY